MSYAIIINNIFIYRSGLQIYLSNESKILFLRIRKPTPKLISALIWKCTKHLEINQIDNINFIKKRSCGWFSTWRVRLYNECTELAFDFLDRYR